MADPRPTPLESSRRPVDNSGGRRRRRPSVSRVDTDADLGGYRPRRLLGRGGQGRVWRAVAPSGPDVALKILDGPVSRALAAARRQVACALTTDHPHLLGPREVVCDGDRVALVSPLAEGGSLAELVERCGPLRPEQAHFGIRLAIHELRNFVENGLDQAELDRIRDYLDGYYALFLQTESRRLGYAIDDAFYGVDRPWLERLRAAWRELTPEQVNAVIRRHIDPARLQIAMIAPDASALADRIASEQSSPMEYPGRTLPPEVLEQDRVVQDLRIGVPRERIQMVSPAVDNTRDELVATAAWLRQRKLTRLLIVTSPYHTRRVQVLSRADLRGLHVGVVAAPVQEGLPRFWWAREYDRFYVRYELAALVATWWRHGLWPWLPPAAA